MLTKRIIPCLDVKNGRTVKGVRFKQIIDAGDPVEQAKIYQDQGADELVFLDISATLNQRSVLLTLVEQIAMEINIPFTVGGGIGSLSDVSALLNAGADKVSVNSAAILNPVLLQDISNNFGSQCLVLAVDAKEIDGVWQVYRSGGTIPVGIELMEWLKIGVSHGAGEILFTAMNFDGTKNGFANSMLRRISREIAVPVIASGGAGECNDFRDVFLIGEADAALAASVFHFGDIEIGELKKQLAKEQIPVRL